MDETGTAPILEAISLLAGSLLLDAFVRPRKAGGALPGLRSFAGMWLHGLTIAGIFGFVLAVSGNTLVAALLSMAFMALLMVVSNAKRAMLGEALVFSDFALIGAIFKHPQFYFSALTRSQKAVLAIAAPVVPGIILTTFVSSLAPHVTGLAILVLSFCCSKCVRGCRCFPDFASMATSSAMSQTMACWLH